MSLRAWRALRSASVESRFEALHATGVTELVGREEELWDDQAPTPSASRRSRNQVQQNTSA